MFGGNLIQFPNHVQLNLASFIFNEKRLFQSVKMSCLLSIKQIQVNYLLGFKEVCLCDQRIAKTNKNET